MLTGTVGGGEDTLWGGESRTKNSLKSAISTLRGAGSEEKNPVDLVSKKSGEEQARAFSWRNLERAEGGAEQERRKKRLNPLDEGILVVHFKRKISAQGGGAVEGG